MSFTCKKIVGLKLNSKQVHKIEVLKTVHTNWSKCRFLWRKMLHRSCSCFLSLRNLM